MRQRVCKPGSVFALRQWATIPLGPPLPTASSNQPGRRSRAGPYAVPIRSCSRWGLPCQPCCQGRGALLPHRFALTAPKRGGLFSVALSLGLPQPGVTRHRYSVEPGLSSPVCTAAVAQPSGTRRPYSSPCGLGSSSASRIARHSPSISPSINSGRNRRWKATMAANRSVTS